MKTIALLPFRNEEWALPSYLYNITKIADEIIAIDDGSTDSSKKILEDAGAKVYSSEKLKMHTSGWSEGAIRSELLRLGRESGGTHFICLDADEALSNNFVKNYKKIAQAMIPGQKISMQWLALWKSYTHYRDDETVWSKNWKDFLFMDDGVSEYNASQHMHVERTPGSNYGRCLVINPDAGAVLHFQFSVYNNFQLKQCWLRCSDLIQRPYDSSGINNQYSITLLDDNVKLTEMPIEWYENIPIPKFDNFDPEWNESSFVRKDLLSGIFKYFDDYGVEFFRPLDIWHIPQLRERLEKEISN